MCNKENLKMATNLAIDIELLEEAQKIGKMKTKKATVNLALKEFVNRRKQREIVDLFGTMVAEEGYDYKAGRK